MKKAFESKSTYAGIALVASLYMLSKAAKNQSPTSTKLSYFLLALSQNIISEVIVQGKTIIFRPSNGNQYYQTDASMLSKDKIFTLISEKPEIVFSSIEKNKNVEAMNLLVTAAGALLGYTIISRYLFPKKEITKIDDELRVGVKFDDIYGMFEAKKQLQEIIDFLQHPAKY